MTLASASSPAPARSGFYWRDAATFAPMALIVATAIAVQMRLGAVDDVSWLITAGEKTLDGQIPYRDFIEINPPASILIYLPPIFCARLFGVAPEIMVAAFGLLGAALSVTLSAIILARGALLEKLGAIGANFAVAALILLPAHAFDERDHIAALAGLPFAALAAARGNGARIDWRLALLAGAGAGIMAAIKPPYALAALALALYLAARLGWRAVFSCLEYYAAAMVGIAYGAITIIFFPAFVTDIMPIASAVYLPVRQSIADLWLNPGVIVCVTLLLAAAQAAGRSWREPLFAAPALAALGALASFFVQGKGWSYQIYPALAFAVMALGAALAPRKGETALLAAAIACAIATAAAAMTIGRWPVQIMVGAGIAAAMLTVRLPRSRRVSADGGLALPLGEMLAASAIGIAFAILASEGLPQPKLEKALARLGPHPTLLAISESLAFGHPLARDVGGIWVQRVPSLWITAAGQRLIDESHGDARLRERLAPFMRADKERLLQDIAAKRPDAILIGRTDGPLYKALASDPAIAAALADYRFLAGNDDPAWPAMIFARRDLISLRPRIEPDTSADAAGPKL